MCKSKGAVNKIDDYEDNYIRSIKLLGKFTETVQTKKKLTVATFDVVKGNSGSLINAETAAALELIKFTNKINVKDSIVRDYPDVFNGKVGKMKGIQIKLHIDKNVKPVVQQYLRVLLPIRKKVEAELRRLENAGIIEKVDGPTDWVSPIVIQSKENSEEIRICIDMREANKAIHRTRHTIPTIEEIRHELNGAKHFSKIDLKNA